MHKAYTERVFRLAYSMADVPQNFPDDDFFAVWYETAQAGDEEEEAELDTDNTCSLISKTAYVMDAPVEELTLQVYAQCVHASLNDTRRLNVKSSAPEGVAWVITVSINYNC